MLTEEEIDRSLAEQMEPSQHIWRFEHNNRHAYLFLFISIFITRVCKIRPKKSFYSYSLEKTAMRKTTPLSKHVGRLKLPLTFL